MIRKRSTNLGRQFISAAHFFFLVTLLLNPGILRADPNDSVSSHPAKLPDVLILANGDKISGRLIRLTVTQVEFLTAYAGLLHIERRQVSRLSTSTAVQVDLVSGERIIGKIAMTETEKLIVESRVLGVREFTFDIIREISGATSEEALAEVKGKGESGGESPVTKPIGEKPQEEDIRKVFFRQSSVLLRRRGEFEGELGFGYTRNRIWSLIDIRTRQLSLTSTVRVGLSNRAETFVSMPLSYADLDVAGDSNSKTGIGDLSAGIKYLLAQESARWPDVVLSMGFTAPTGSQPNQSGLALGSGHWGSKIGVQSIKTYDPVVIFWGVDYTHQFESRHFFSDAVHDVQPGENFGYNLGLGFAINQKISVSGHLLGNYITEDKIDGEHFVGSSSEPISLRFAVVNRWSKNTFFETGVMFGLNNDAPDLSLTFSLVHRR